VEAPPQRVLGPQEFTAHVYELAEARWERELWHLFDRAVVPSGATCPEGHPLERDTDESLANAGEVICDQCERVLVLMNSYTCTGGCDFDICQECFNTIGGDSAKAADPVAWLQQQLAEFWQAHPGFRLPPEPPRADTRLKGPSSAVVKWNNFTMGGGDLAPRLRELFLRTLESHGADVAHLRLYFWPGCVEELSRAQGYVAKARGNASVAEWSQNKLACAGATVAVGEGPPCRLQRRRSGRQWELEDGREVMLEAGSPGPTRVAGPGGALAAWLVSGPEALHQHAGQLLAVLGPGWCEAWAGELLAAAVSLLEDQDRQQQERAMAQEALAVALGLGAGAGAGEAGRPGR